MFDKWASIDYNRDMKEIERQTMTDTREILKRFGIDRAIRPHGNGHINDTYITEDGEYILQRINTTVFSNPKALTDNIVLVTGYLKKWLSLHGGDPERETLTPIPALDGKWFAETEEGEFFRVYKAIADSVSYDSATPELLYRAAKGFGRFQKMLADFPADRLSESIPDFHNTRARFGVFKRVSEADPCGRADSAKDEIAFCMAHEQDTGVVVDAIGAGKLPLRVTHNDTKLNNVLIDSTTGRAVCVIDLDTVMPGLCAYDFGDAIRFGASTAAEDEKDLSKVHLDMELYRAYAEGYLSEVADALTPREVDSLAIGAKMMTLENGIRFLGDYLNGDIYFKTAYPEHNLVRARTQFKLLSEMDEHWDEMLSCVRELARKGK